MLVAFPLSPNNQTLRTTETVLPEAAKDEEGEAGALITLRGLRRTTKRSIVIIPMRK
jgi:hypothetical protein